MTVHLPEDVERSMEEAVRNGHFASLDEAITEAARLLLGGMKLSHSPSHSDVDHNPPDPVLGCMREDADLMDEIVAETYRHRRDETWREIDL
jgi:Arc/MetJ-type ribon-helix-helix transcriptional regulator